MSKIYAKLLILNIFMFFYKSPYADLLIIANIDY